MVLRLPRSPPRQTVINISDLIVGQLGQRNVAYIIVSITRPYTTVFFTILFIVAIFAFRKGISNCGFNDRFMFNVPRTSQACLMINSVSLMMRTAILTLHSPHGPDSYADFWKNHRSP